MKSLYTATVVWFALLGIFSGVSMFRGNDALVSPLFAQKNSRKDSRRESAAQKERDDARKKRAKENEQTHKELAKQLAKIMSNFDDNGFSGSVLVCKDGVDLLNEGYGDANVEKKLKNKKDTFYDIGSVGKQITGAAILKLQMMKKLKLSDKINEHFKGVPEDKSEVTIHHLLTHTSGISIQLTFEGVDHRMRDDMTKYVLKAPMTAKPGEKYEYSNPGYFLLGALIEIVSGKKLEDFFKKQLFSPARMKDTFPLSSKLNRAQEQRDPRRYSGEQSDQDVGSMVDWGWHWGIKGAGGIVSTTGDLKKWNYALEGSKLLSEEAKKELYEPFLNAYACGWFVSKTQAGTPMYYHGGASKGARCYYTRFPEDDIVVVVCSNKDNNDYSVVSQALVTAMLSAKTPPTGE